MTRPLSPTTKWILSQSPDMSAAEIVKQSKAAGFPTSVGNVHKVRHKYMSKKAGAAKKASAPSKLRAAKKGSGRVVNKAQFIRQFPDAKPIEVAEKARAAGLKISPQHVAAVRSADRKSGKTKGGASAPRGRASSGAVKTITITGLAGPSAKADQAFIAATLGIGVDRALRLIEVLRKATSSIRA